MSETTSEVVLVAGGARLGARHEAALARVGCRVIHAARQGDTLVALSSHRPAIVLIGTTLAAQAVAQHITQAGLPTRMIVLTARPTLRGATTALRLGAADYLASDVSAARLIASVRRVLATASPIRSTAIPTGALRDKDDLISLVSHELRTPLMAVNGYLEILQKYHDKLPSEKARDFIGRSLQATGELAYLSDMLVQVLQFEAGRLAPRMAAVVLAPLVRAAIEQCDLLVAGHTIVCEVAPDLVVRADAMALQQIVRNLISNAIKYSPQGGTITLRAHRAAGEMLALSVRDEGIGIAPEQLPLLFQRFARVHDAGAWPSIRGTGLGLYRIARKAAVPLGHADERACVGFSQKPVPLTNRKQGSSIAPEEESRSC